MKHVIMPKGVLCEVFKVIPYCEKRFHFNGKPHRFAEVAEDLREATALYFKVTPSNGGFGTFPAYDDFLVGNLKPEVVREILNGLLTDGRYDLSVFDYQKKRYISEVVLDSGKSSPYSSEYTFDAKACLNLSGMQPFGEDVFSPMSVGHDDGGADDVEFEGYEEDNCDDDGEA